MDTNSAFAAGRRYAFGLCLLVVAAVFAQAIWAQAPDRGASRPASSRESVPRTCDDIAAVIAKAVDRSESRPGLISPGDLDCRAAADVPARAPLEWQKTFWDPRLETWEFSLRCQRRSQCVPFLVRVRRDSQAKWNHLLGARTGPEANSGRVEILRDASAFAIRPGQTAELVWEQSGIRIAVPVTCLDAGRIGDAVRVRTREAGGAILRAQVLPSGRLTWLGTRRGAEQ